MKGGRGERAASLQAEDALCSGPQTLELVGDVCDELVRERVEVLAVGADADAVPQTPVAASRRVAPRTPRGN